MDESSKLIPSAIKAQCQEIISNLEADNKSLLNAMSFTESFATHGVSEAKALEALKEQLGNFKSAINLLCSANEADIASCKDLMNKVGDEELIGKDLLEQLELAKNELAKSEENLNKYRNTLNKMTHEDDSYFHATKMFTKNKELCEVNTEVIAEIQAKIDLYDEIAASSSGMFQNGAGLRNSGLMALQEISKSSYTGGTYSYTPNAKLTEKINLSLNENQLATYQIRNPEPEKYTYTKNSFDVTDDVEVSLKTGQVSFVQGFEYAALNRVNNETDQELNVAGISGEAYGGVTLMNESREFDPSIQIGEELHFEYASTTDQVYSFEKEIAGQNISINGTHTGAYGVFEVESEANISKQDGISFEGDMSLIAAQGTEGVNIQVNDYEIDCSITYDLGVSSQGLTGETAEAVEAAADESSFDFDITNSGLEVSTPWFEIEAEWSKNEE